MILPVDDQKLVVTVRHRNGPKAIIYFGGNAEDVSFNLSSFRLAFPDYSLYFLHYRGYGGSSGKPSEAALNEDALRLFDKVRSEHRDIAIIGRSLGTGVAVRLASERSPSRLILITPFNSLEEIAADQFPYAPVKWLMLDKFDSARYAPKIVSPTTIVVAENDEVIPSASTKKLFERFGKGVVTMKVIASVGHNTILNSPDYLVKLKAAL
jgi:pimeloyl-ACP methyl ester carboxylesterase